MVGGDEMTTLTMLAVPAHHEEDESLGPMPWRRMAWVTWRQHRTALTGVATLFVAMAVGFSIAGLQLHHAYAAAIACHPTGSFACSALNTRFNGMYGFLANGLILQVIPPLIGAFVGAPVLARELESGTFRFAWTQGFGRWRWTLAKLVALGVVVTVAAGALCVLFSWYYQPYFPIGDQGLSLTKALPIGASSPFAPGLFDLRGVSFAAWTLAAFAIGVVAGILIRRVVPAIVATLAVYTGLAFATGGYLRQHYVAPLVTSSLNVPGTAWILSQQWFTKSGRPVSTSVLGQVLQERAPSQIAGKGGVPQSLASWQYLTQHGYTQLTTYQPTSRFWPFQWIEGGWLLALSLLLIAATIWLVRRRAS
jgi:ABC-type transport system involved in multi-copper enzyme maturation permease subunit